MLMVLLNDANGAGGYSNLLSRTPRKSTAAEHSRVSSMGIIWACAASTRHSITREAARTGSRCGDVVAMVFLMEVIGAEMSCDVWNAQLPGESAHSIRGGWILEKGRRAACEAWGLSSFVYKAMRRV